MPPLTGPNLGLQHSWAQGESGWKPGMDDNLKKLDALAQLQVLDKDLNAPPGSPTNGDRYIVGSAPSGAWAGFAKYIAVWDSAAALWTLYAPLDGWLAWVTDENKLYVYNGGAWGQWPATLTGTTWYEWIRPAGFGVPAKAIRGVGAEVVDYPDADTEFYTSLVVPSYVASLASATLFFAPNGNSANGTVWAIGAVIQGVGQGLAAAFTYGADTAVPVAGVTDQVVAGALNLPASLSGSPLPGDIYKIALKRKASAGGDTNPNTLQFVGILLAWNHN